MMPLQARAGPLIAGAREEWLFRNPRHQTSAARDQNSFIYLGHPSQIRFGCLAGYGRAGQNGSKTNLVAVLFPLNTLVPQDVRPKLSRRGPRTPLRKLLIKLSSLCTPKRTQRSGTHSGNHPCQVEPEDAPSRRKIAGVRGRHLPSEEHSRPRMSLVRAGGRDFAKPLA